MPLRPPRVARASARGLWPLLAGLGLGCSGPSAAQPDAALAESTSLQQELRGLEERWELAPRGQRGRLRPELEGFVTRAGTDPSAARARLLLGLSWLDEERLERVERAVGPLLVGAEGRTRDEAEVLMAAVERRRGRPDVAVERLTALDGKLFSEEFRELALRERIQAALSLRRWRGALDGVVAWLGLAPRLSPGAEAWVRSLLAEIPIPALAIVLADYSESPAGPEEAAARQWLERAIIELLTREALAKRDARLARELLAHSPIWLRTSEVGDELSILATQAGEAASVAGRTVGVVLGGQSPIEQTRTLRLVSALLEGLGLGGDEGGVRVIVEEDRGSLATSLASLSGQGALLLVAGATDDAAASALRFAEARQIPVVTFAAPRGAVEGEFGFVVGEDEARQARLLEQALRERGHEPLARVGGAESGATSCNLPFSRPGVPSFPLGQWSRDGVRGVLLLGDASCARRLQRELGERAGQLWLGLGLEASEVRLAEMPRTLRLDAGSFAREREEARAAAPRGEGFGMRRGWFEALGADLARLARAALAELPASAALDEREVHARHLRVRDALLRVEVELESSEARGFRGAHRLERTLRVVAPEAQ